MSSATEILESAKVLSREEQRNLVKALLLEENARSKPEQSSSNQGSDDVFIISERIDWDEYQSMEERNASLPDLRIPS